MEDEAAVAVLGSREAWIIRVESVALGGSNLQVIAFQAFRSTPSGANLCQKQTRIWNIMNGICTFHDHMRQSHTECRIWKRCGEFPFGWGALTPLHTESNKGPMTGQELTPTPQSVVPMARLPMPLLSFSTVCNNVGHVPRHFCSFTFVQLCHVACQCPDRCRGGMAGLRGACTLSSCAPRAQSPSRIAALA